MFAPFFSALILCAVCQLICCLVPLCLRQHALACSVRVRFVSLCESHSDVMICSSCVELENIYCTETSGFSLFCLMELLVWLSCGLVGLFQPSNRKAKHLQLDFFLRRCAAFSTVWKLSIIKSSNLHPSALVWSFAHVYSTYIYVYMCICVCILWVCGRGEGGKLTKWTAGTISSPRPWRELKIRQSRKRLRKQSILQMEGERESGSSLFYIFYSPHTLWLSVCT